MFLPSDVRGLLSHFFALFGGHGSEAALPAYSSPTLPHSGHDAGDVGLLHSRDRCSIGAGQLAHHLKGGLVYIGRLFANTLWHGFSMPPKQPGCYAFSK
jgi:hypothetical protein